MKHIIDTHRRPEVAVEHGPIGEYLRGLEELADVAAQAQQEGDMDTLQQIVCALETLARDFGQPDQIEREVQRLAFHQAQAETLPEDSADQFVAEKVSQWLAVCAQILRTGVGAEQLSRKLKPVLEKQMVMLGIQTVQQVEVPAAMADKKSSIPKTNVKRVAAEMMAGVAIMTGAIYGTNEANKWLQQRAAEQAALEQWRDQYNDIPVNLREHLVGINLAEPIDFKPQPGWVEQGNGVYQWGERTVLAEPDGSALYIPANTEFNKAFILPPNSRGNIDWHATRFPVQIIQRMGLSLQPNGLWGNHGGGMDSDYAVLDGGHLLFLNVDSQPTEFIAFNGIDPHPIAQLAELYRAPVDMSQIDTSIPAGFVDAEVQPSLRTIQFNINFKTYDNTNAGVPVYPPDFKCMIPERMVADLAALEADLIAHGYHLGITEALRPEVVQAYLHDNMKEGMAAAPGPKARHMQGMALDIVILNLDYLPIFDTGFIQFHKSDQQVRGASADSKSIAKVEVRPEQNAQRDEIKQIFAAHGFEFNNPKEAWHVEYTK